MDDTAPAAGDASRRSSDSPAHPTRLDWVSWIKLLAILGVISIHNARPTLSSHAPAVSDTDKLVAAWFDIAFVIAVPLFIMVSGALVLNPQKFVHTKTFLRRRAARIIPALIVWNLIFLLLRQAAIDHDMSWSVALQRVINVDVADHLYFFWVIFGLWCVAPLLILWIRHTHRREWIIAGAGLAVLAATTTIVERIRTSSVPLDDQIVTDLPWTQWIPYTGLFILGFALREVRLRGINLLIAATLWVYLAGVLWWQYLTASTWMHTVLPLSYSGPLVIIATVTAYLVLKSVFVADGALRALVSPRVMRWVNPVANATLGIYALHPLIQHVLARYEIFGPTGATAEMLAPRYLAITALTLVIVLPLRRMRYVRSIL